MESLNQIARVYKGCKIVKGGIKMVLEGARAAQVQIGGAGTRWDENKKIKVLYSLLG